MRIICWVKKHVWLCHICIRCNKVDKYGKKTLLEMAKL